MIRGLSGRRGEGLTHAVVAEAPRWAVKEATWTLPSPQWEAHLSTPMVRRQTARALAVGLSILRSHRIVTSQTSSTKKSLSSWRQRISCHPNCRRTRSGLTSFYSKRLRCSMPSDLCNCKSRSSLTTSTTSCFRRSSASPTRPLCKLSAPRGLRKWSHWPRKWQKLPIKRA